MVYKPGIEIFYDCPDKVKSGWYTIDRIRKTEGEKDVYLISNDFHTIETTSNYLKSKPADPIYDDWMNNDWEDEDDHMNY